MSISQQTAHRTAILVLVLSGALGCVTSTTHDRVLGERDTLRRHAAALTSDKEALEAHVAGLEATRSSLTSELSATKANVSDLTGTYDGLLEDLKSEVAAGQIEIRQMRDGIRVRVDDEVLFASGSSEVDESGRLVMRKVASQLVGIPNPVRVDGHTDNVPISGGLKSKFPSNWELAGARATSIVRLLQEQGVAGTRLMAVSSGEFAPRVANDSDESRSKNRRIEIRLLPVTEDSDGDSEAVAGEKAAGKHAPLSYPASASQS